MTTRPGFSFCICPDGKLLRQQVEELLGAHPDAGRERHVFWGDDELPPKFWEILTLQGLFSTSRVLVMRNAPPLTADAALLLARMKDAQLAPLEAAAEDAGVDPTHFYTTRTLAEAFLAACDKERMESFAPLFTGSSTAGQAALAALLPNTFLQALVWRTLTAPALPEVTEDEGL